MAGFAATALPLVLLALLVVMGWRQRRSPSRQQRVVAWTALATAVLLALVLGQLVVAAFL